MDQPQTLDRIRAVVVFLTCLFMIGSNVVNGTKVSEVAESPTSGVIDPATWAFGIWGLIFLLALIHAGYQLLPRNLVRPVFRATGWPLATTFLLTGLWPIAVVAGQLNVAQLLLAAMWALLALVFLRVARVGDLASRDRWLVALPVAPFFGWLTAANPVSVFSRLTDTGIVTPHGAGNLVGVGLLLITGCIAAWFVREGQRGPAQLWGAYALTIGWAIVGIVANQPGLTSLGAVGSLVAAIPVVVASWVGVSQPGGPSRPVVGSTLA
ncbi:MAG: hypothetical protein U0075_16605 [Thermomicrobiales bacterium]